MSKADNSKEEKKEEAYETSADVEPIPTFDSMGLKDTLLRGIYAYGFEKHLLSSSVLLPPF